STVNFYRTQFGYDKRGLPDKVVDDVGTITRTVHDAMGRVVSTWIGLDDKDDNPGNGIIYWSPANASDPEFDLVKVDETEYDGSGVSIVDTTPADGVPDTPNSSKLRAYSQASYDAQNRVYETRKYSVNQTSGGTPSANSLRTDYWFDHRGDVIKTSEPGGLV